MDSHNKGGCYLLRRECSYARALITKASQAARTELSVSSKSRVLCSFSGLASSSNSRSSKLQHARAPYDAALTCEYSPHKIMLRPEHA